MLTPETTREDVRQTDETRRRRERERRETDETRRRRERERRERDLVFWQEIWDIGHRAE